MPKGNDPRTDHFDWVEVTTGERLSSDRYPDCKTKGIYLILPGAITGEGALPEKKFRREFFKVDNGAL